MTTITGAKVALQKWMADGHIAGSPASQLLEAFRRTADARAALLSN